MTIAQLDRPVENIPDLPSNLFFEFRKLGARTVGDCFLAIEDPDVHPQLREQFADALGVAEFTTDIRDACVRAKLKRLEKLRLASIATATLPPPQPDASSQNPALTVRFADLGLDDSTLAMLRDMGLETLEGLCDCSTVFLWRYHLPRWFRMRMNEITDNHGLPRKFQIRRLRKEQ
jgi:hypothetical protein